MKTLAVLMVLVAVHSGVAESEMSVPSHGAAGSVTAADDSAAATGAVWPVEGTIVRRFIAPECDKCRGPRGVTFVVAEGSLVRAAVEGEVSFVGQVSRRLYVVQRLGNGVLLTYGWLAGAEPGLAQGHRALRGAVLGRTGTSFYLGARIAGRYVDPLVLLGFGRVRLVGPGAIGRAEPSR